jgi:hypothetical protein
MKILISAAALVGGTIVSGCASSTTEAVMRLDPARAQSVGLGEVVVTDESGATSATMVPTMTAAIRAKVANCARGNAPTRFEVRVTELTGQNAAKTLLLGDAARARGTVKLIDTATGATIGDYDLNHSKGGGGVIGMIALADAERDMGNAFGDQICNRILAGR